MMNRFCQSTKVLGAHSMGIEHNSRIANGEEVDCVSYAIIWLDSADEVQAYFDGVNDRNFSEYQSLADRLDEESGAID
jgi:hypothetical protein